MTAAAVKEPGDSVLWLADTAALTDARLACYADWLGESERRRHARFIRAERRRQFVAGRALLRMALGRLLAIEPGSIGLEDRPGQAPAFVHPHDPGIGLSISHSGRWVACAVSTVTLVGLDIERIDPSRDVLALAEQALSPESAGHLRACSEDARVGSFYRLWCLHEAGIKLATASAADYLFEHDGFAGALRCARPLATAPVPVVIEL